MREDSDEGAESDPLAVSSAAYSLRDLRRVPVPMVIVVLSHRPHPPKVGILQTNRPGGGS